MFVPNKNMEPETEMKFKLMKENLEAWNLLFVA